MVYLALEIAQKRADEGNDVDAANIYTYILQGHPDNALALYGRGVALLSCDLPERALNDLNRACEIEPSNGRIYGVRSFVYSKLDRHTDALADVNTLFWAKLAALCSKIRLELS